MRQWSCPLNLVRPERNFFGHSELLGGGECHRKRYTDEQIAFALRQAENGTAVEEICRRMGVSEPTFYRWSSAGPSPKAASAP